MRKVTLILVFFVSVVSFALVLNWPYLRYNWTVYSMRRQSSKFDKFEYSELIARQSKHDGLLMSEIVENIVDLQLSDEDRSMLVPALFTADNSETAPLTKLLNRLELSAEKSPVTIEQLGSSAFKHGHSDVAWKALGSLLSCAETSTQCLTGTYALLMAAPTSESDVAKHNLKQLLQMFPETTPTATLTYVTLIRNGVLNTSLTLSSKLTKEDFDLLSDELLGP